MAAMFGDDLITPNDLSVPQYEAIYAYKAAVEMAGSTEPQAVIDVLDDVSVTGPRGTITMNAQRHAPLTMYLGQVQADGSVNVIQSFENVDPGEQCPQFAG
ncbi:MAG: transporter substrate-binding protein, partial [Pseudomonadota bacterium]